MMNSWDALPPPPLPKRPVPAPEPASGNVPEWVPARLPALPASSTPPSHRAPMRWLAPSTSFSLASFATRLLAGAADTARWLGQVLWPRLAPWLPWLALPGLGWLSYLTLQGELAQVRTEGGLSHVHPALWMLALWVLTVCDVLLCYVRYQRWQAHSQRSTTRGAAHWATGSELAPYRARRGEAALVLGTLGGQRLALSERRQCEHVLLVGPQGKGKGVYVIVPSLLRESGTRSLFIIDPKSELVGLTAAAVAEHHQVWIFAPDAPAQSMTYNPLAHIQTFEDAQDFAHCWVQNTGVSEPYYAQQAETLLTSVALHLHATEPDAPLARLAELLVTWPFEQLLEALQASPAPVARDLCASLLRDLQKHPQAQASARAGLAQRLLLLHSPSVQAVTASNSVDFVQMAQTPTALYLSIPSSASTRLRPLSACLLMQMFATWMRLAEQHGGRLPRQIMCYLDEFGNAGTIPHFAERIATLRSFRVSLLITIQSFAQLQKLYGKDTTDILLGNAATHLVLHGVGKDEARFYSERIGDTTLRIRSQSGSGAGTIQEVARRLILPDEIRTMPEGQLLVLADHAHPVRVQARPYYRDQRLSARANRPVPRQVVPSATPFEAASIHPSLWMTLPAEEDAQEADVPPWPPDLVPAPWSGDEEQA